SFDRGRFAAFDHQALGDPPQGGGRGRGARWPVVARRGVPALYAHRRRVFILAIVDRAAWARGTAHDPHSAISARRRNEQAHWSRLRRALPVGTRPAIKRSRARELSLHSIVLRRLCGLILRQAMVPDERQLGDRKKQNQNENPGKLK